MACGCAMASPVLTTRSGLRSSRERIHDMSLLRPGVRCVSEMCNTRSGPWPGGRPGISNRRKANQFRSISVAYPMAAAPTAAVAGMSVRSFPHPWCHGHRCAAVADDRRPLSEDGLVAELKERLRADLNPAMLAPAQAR